eukprot:CAMPEP_0175222700 /NCGR_PEP_ID=MMETSP0093-20121207/20960_1 /TAXON_ID=311494 /ORGANISM="Alexandrium monilatum, Strain CCMP3105" /LENGTH=198 /DNA_ID=CAMNT_0016516297 /DNA_START=138 /DNA_END=732 /DNA_ORIENTATION=+
MVDGCHKSQDERKKVGRRRQLRHNPGPQVPVRPLVGVQHQRADVVDQMLGILCLADLLVPPEAGAEERGPRGAGKSCSKVVLRQEEVAAKRWVTREEEGDSLAQPPPLNLPSPNVAASATTAQDELTARPWLPAELGKTRSCSAGSAPGPFCRNAKAEQCRRVSWASGGRNSLSAMLPPPQAVPQANPSGPAEPALVA